MQIQAQPQEYDAIVVGSGASGGWAAKRMAEAGMRVALVCAGRPLKDGDYREHVQPYELKYQARANDLIRRTQPVQKDCYACTEYNSDWFCNDIDEPYTTEQGKPFSWQGRMRVTGGRTNVWGRHSYRFTQQDLKGYSFDGAGTDWPLDYKDLGPLLRAGRGLRRHLRPGRKRARAARQQVPAGDAVHLRRGQGPQFNQDEVRPHHDDGAPRQPDQADQRPPGLPLLRPVRARLRHALVFQFRLHHRRRRAEDRQVHAHPERHGLSGADGQGDQQGARRHLRRSDHARDARGPRQDRGAVRAGARVDAHPVQFGARRPRQFERRARPLPDGSHVGRGRRQRRVPRHAGQAEPERRPAAGRHVRDPLPQHDERREAQGLPARLRLPGRQRAQLRAGRAGLRPGLQGGRQERPVDA